MVLDPLTTLGIVANIVQFVDFGSRLINTSIELYKHKNLPQHIQIREQTEQLQQFNTILESRLVAISQAQLTQNTSRSKDTSRLPDNLQTLLKEAVTISSQCANDLLQAIDKVTVSGRHPKWQSFRHALSSVLGDSGLDEAKERLNQARQNVTLFLILHTSVHQSAVMRGSNEEVQQSILTAVQESTKVLTQRINTLAQDLKRTNPSTVEAFVSDARRDNRDIIDPISNKIGDVLIETARQRFLESLKFNSMKKRHDVIVQAHRSTLSWVLESDSHKDIAWDNFPSWLLDQSSQNNLYWISGKPGSGKSTLMRHLADSMRSQRLIARWAGSRRYILLSCFFWHTGDVLQKSMQGLLRTLSCQLLVDDVISDAALAEICPPKWQEFLYDQPGTIIAEWDLIELFELFRNIVSYVTKVSSIIIFVDGLDEFGATRSEREDLISLFLEMHNKPHIKLCLSSRPWNEFKDTLAGFPTLRLEDLTRQDMEDYVEAELGRCRAFQDLAVVADQEVTQLKTELVSKSQGVFLWLFLVTRRLRFAAQDGKSLRKLVNMLDEIPPDLDEFFQHMLARIPEQDRVQASKIFQLVLGSSSDMPTLMTLSFTDEDDEDFAYSEEIHAESDTEILSRIVTFKRRLNSQCMDLLICGRYQTGSYLCWEDTRVEYLHRTVKDFLDTSQARETLNEHTHGPVDVEHYFLNAHFTELSFHERFVSNLASDRILSKNDLGLAQRDSLFRLSFILQYLKEASDTEFARRVFEDVVDVINHRLSGQSAFETEDYSSDVNQHQAIKLYQAGSNSVSNKYLYMALLASHNNYAKSFMAAGKGVTDVSLYFLAALGIVTAFGYTSIRPRNRTPDSSLANIDIALSLLERWQPVNNDISVLNALLRCYPVLLGWLVAIGPPSPPHMLRAHKGVLLILESTKRATATDSQLQELRRSALALIEKAQFLDSITNLIEVLDRVQLTWVPTTPVDRNSPFAAKPAAARKSWLSRKFKSAFN